jgi:hypothetical protein
MQRLLIPFLGLLFLTGCGGNKNNSGITGGSVTYKGQPVNGGSLLLFQATGAGDSFAVPLTQEGTFRAAGVPPGEYKVVIRPASGTQGVPSLKGMDPAKQAEWKDKIEAMKSPPTIPIPSKYKQVASTDLKLTIPPDGEATANLELKD